MLPNLQYNTYNITVGNAVNMCAVETRKSVQWIDLELYLSTIYTFFFHFVIIYLRKNKEILRINVSGGGGNRRTNSAKQL